jgi:hypothetical protein
LDIQRRLLQGRVVPA